MNEFFKNIICAVFGHQIDGEALSMVLRVDIKYRDFHITYCRRCDNYRMFKSFRVYRL